MSLSINLTINGMRRKIELDDPRAQRLFGSPEMYTPRVP